MKGFAAFALAIVVAATAWPAEPTPSGRRPFPEIQLLDAQGAAHDLKTILGRVTVLNFWATWCGPCRQELPELQQLYNELGGRGMALLAVNVDSPREQVGPFLKRANLSLPVFFLDEETEATIGIRSLPTTVLLDAEGGIVNIWGGYSREEVLQLREQVEGLLAQTRGRGGK
jgi:cytochrome c biogenesis protein CcmG, thiol:disulfide interchange protein DsbE